MARAGLRVLCPCQDRAPAAPCCRMSRCLYVPVAAAAKRSLFFDAPGRTHPTQATPQRHFVRSALNQRSEVAAPTSADFVFSDSRTTNPCHRRRMVGPMSGREREKEGPFSPQRYMDVRATRHATAWSRRVRGPGKDTPLRQPPRATAPLRLSWRREDIDPSSLREPPTQSSSSPSSSSLWDCAATIAPCHDDSPQRRQNAAR